MKSTVDPPRPVKQRAWFDPRFAIGLILVVASVAGVSWVVAAADTSTPVLAARTPLSIGDRVDSRDFTVVSVRLERFESRYLRPADLPAEGIVIGRAIGEGELVPLSAVGTSASDSLSSVVIEANGTLSHSVTPSSTVDVWTAAETDAGKFGAPAVAVSGATVVRLIEPSGIVVDESASAVELLVPDSDIARLLESIANDDAISLVPSTIPLAD